MNTDPSDVTSVPTLSEIADQLTSRIDRLERENRRIRRSGIVLASAGAVLGFFGLIGMGAPALCDTVSAERLVLRDTSGRQRILADAYSGVPALSLFSVDGRVLARMGVGKEGDACLTFFDAQGNEKGTWQGTAPDPARPGPARSDAGPESKPPNPAPQARPSASLR